MKYSLYQVLLFIHRWFGITVGFFFVLLGLTGSYLVYKDSFQSWIARDIRTSTGAAGKVDLYSSLLSAQQRLETEMAPAGFYWSDDPNQNLRFDFTNLPGKGRSRISVFVDPVTREVKGIEEFSNTISGKIFFFHHDLFLGGVGKLILGVSGTLMLLLLIGGLYLWWPKKKSWRDALRLGALRGGFQTHLELHKFFGFYTLILMIMVTFSGVYIAQPNWFQKVNSSPRRAQSSPMPRVDWQNLLQLLEGESKPLDVRVDVRSSAIRIQNGQGETKILDPLTFTAKELIVSPQNMRAIQRDLHGGLFWGELGKALVFISGLLPLLFYVTGIYLWLKKPQRRRPVKGERRHAS